MAVLWLAASSAKALSSTFAGGSELSASDVGIGCRHFREAVLIRGGKPDCISGCGLAHGCRRGRRRPARSLEIGAQKKDGHQQVARARKKRQAGRAPLEIE